MRTKFLSNQWQRYPPFPKGDGWLGGRLVSVGQSSCKLKNQNGCESLHFVDSTRWHTLPESIRFLPDVLRAGDLLAVRLAEENAVTDVVLLAPSMHQAVDSPSEFSPERAQSWMNFVNEVRAFFTTRGFVEALTPTLVSSPGTEPYLDAFLTEWKDGYELRTLYLPTSPEFHLKKMLANGFEKLFEIKTCFRNGEKGEHHQPEFQMLEWYRAYSDLDAIAQDVSDLLNALPSKRTPVEVREVSVAQLFKEHADFELTPQTTRVELADLCDRLKINRSTDDAWDDLFFRIFLEKIEHEIDPKIPHLVRYYPPSQAALSRILPNGWADRFELYWGGLEIANAFHELNDPNENRKRFHEDAAIKVRLSRAPVPVDQELLEALERGLPPSGGIALGMDRLFMALEKIADIAATRAFPFTRRD